MITVFKHLPSLILLVAVIFKLIYGISFYLDDPIKIKNVTRFSLNKTVSVGSTSNNPIEFIRVHEAKPDSSIEIRSSNRKRRDDSFEFLNPKPADLTNECVPLKSRRYFSDGFCNSVAPVDDVVCTGSCLPINDLPWYAEYIKVWSFGKKMEPKCVDDVIEDKRVKLRCDDGELRYYRIPVVKSCKCVNTAAARSTVVASASPRRSHRKPNKKLREKNRREKTARKSGNFDDSTVLEELRRRSLMYRKPSSSRKRAAASVNRETTFKIPKSRTTKPSRLKRPPHNLSINISGISNGSRSGQFENISISNGSRSGQFENISISNGSSGGIDGSSSGHGRSSDISINSCSRRNLSSSSSISSISINISSSIGIVLLRRNGDNISKALPNFSTRSVATDLSNNNNGNANTNVKNINHEDKINKINITNYYTIDSLNYSQKENDYNFDNNNGDDNNNNTNNNNNADNKLLDTNSSKIVVKWT